MVRITTQLSLQDFSNSGFTPSAKMGKVPGKSEHAGHPSETQLGRLICGDRNENVIFSGKKRFGKADWKDARSC